MSFVPSENCDRPGEGPAGRRVRAFLTGSHFFRQVPTGTRSAVGVIWLAFVVFPVINAIGKPGPAVPYGLTIVGAALFVAAYVGMVATWRLNYHNPLTLLLFALMLCLATALTLAQSSGWGFLFIYCTACIWLVVPKQLGILLMGLCSALAGGISALGGANGGTAIGFFASSLGVGLLMLLLSDLRLRNRQLSEARAELAQLAVAEERERFARDLHDLLGHSLSVITLKAELAGRMLSDGPADAAREVAELEQVARTALSEVREAVSGYRQPTLEGELAGARMALAAAGIEADVQQARVSLDPAIEAVLAWTVREGATNVIRHSGARHCTLRITASLTDAGVEVTDDGVGAERSNADGVGAERSNADGVGAERANAGGVGAERSNAGRVGAERANAGRVGAEPANAGRVGAERANAGCVGAERANADRVGAEPANADRVGAAPANAGRVGAAPARGFGESATRLGGTANGVGIPTGGVGIPSGGRVIPTGGGAIISGAPTNGVTVATGTGGRVVGGHGLAGLAERARLVNGTLEAGTLAAGGYRLAVTIPVTRA